MQIDASKSAAQNWFAVQAPTNPTEQQVQQADLIQAVSAVNEAGVFGQEYELTFGQDSGSRRTYIKLVDRNTQETVRQIPPEYVLRLARQAAKRNT